MDDLKRALTKYRDITLQIGMCVENEDYDGVNSLLDEREDVINIIKGLNYKKEELVEICSELKMMEIQENIDTLIHNKHKELKSNLDRVKAGKKVNANYSKKAYVDSVFFNKKV